MPITIRMVYPVDHTYSVSSGTLQQREENVPAFGNSCLPKRWKPQSCFSCFQGPGDILQPARAALAVLGVMLYRAKATHGEVQ